MGKAALAVLAIPVTTATGKLNPFIHRADDVGYGNLLGWAAKIIPAARTSDTPHQIFAPEASE